MAIENAPVPASPLDEKTYEKLKEGLIRVFDRSVYNSDTSGDYARAAAECAHAILAVEARKPPTLK